MRVIKFMKQYKHILYYDLTSSKRNAVMVARLSSLCDKLTHLTVTDDYPENVCHHAFDDCDVLVTGVFDNYEKLLSSNTRIRHICMLASDVSDFSKLRLVERGISLTSGDGYSSDAVAELSVAAMILLLRGVFPFNTSFIKRECGGEIAGSTLGIVGAGRIGNAVAWRAASLGMKIVYFSRRLTLARCEQATRVSLPELFSLSDVVSIHLPLIESTQGLIDFSALQNAKERLVITCPSKLQVFRSGALEMAAASRKIAMWLDDSPSINELDSLMQSGVSLVHSSSIGAQTNEAQVRLMEKILAAL